MIATLFNAHRHVISAILAVLSIAAVTANSHVAHAQNAKLSTQTVKHFIASFPQVKAVVVQHGIESAGKASDDANTLSTVIEAATDETLQTHIDEVVLANGFRNTKDWLSAAQSITKCYAYLKLSPSQAKMRRKLEKAIRKIKKNDFLSDKQKRKLIEAVRANFGAVMEEPPAENLAAVKPFVADLDALVK
jgi:predicted component of type VI protein secretion system